MRIGVLYEVHRLRLGGELRVLESLFDGFKKQGWNVKLTIISKLEGPSYNDIRQFFGSSEPDTIVELKPPNGILSYYRKYAFYRRLGHRFRDCDAVIRLSEYPILSQFIKGKHFYYAQIEVGIIRVPPFLQKSYTHSHGIFLKAYHAPLTKSFEKSGTNVTYVANSNFVKQSVETVWKYRCNDIISPPVKLEHFKQLSQTKKTPFKIVSLGRFNRDKNHTEQLDIFSDLVKESGSDWHLVMIGAADPGSNEILNNLRHIVKDRKIEEKVRILENASSSQIDAELSTSQYFLHTNHREGFGISVIEGIAAGCVPIVPRHTGSGEIVTDELQFSSASEAVDIFKRLSARWIPASILVRDLNVDDKLFQQSWVNLISKSMDR